MRKLKLLKLLSWYKELQEEKTKIRIYHAKMALQKLLEEKKVLEEEYEESFQYLQKRKEFSGEELKAWFSFLGILKEFRDLSEKKIETQKGYLEELREELLAKNREKRLIERLYEKTFLKFNQESFKRFLKELDDLVLLRKGRGFD